VTPLLRRSYRALKGVIHPSLRYAQTVYEDVLSGYVKTGTRWLDVGCGHHILPEWRGDAEAQMLARCVLVVGVDADTQALSKHRSIHVRVAAKLPDLPFRPESFDLVTANMVVEHLATPAADFATMARLLTPGGYLVLHTPNALGHATIGARLVPEPLKKRLVRLLDGRVADDVYPTYYRANTPARIRAHADALRLEVERIALIGSDAVTALVPPLALLELLWIRLVSLPALAPLRSNMIAVLRKPDAGSSPAPQPPPKGRETRARGVTA
jgi:SAM-dependent methyltransferase